MGARAVQIADGNVGNYFLTTFGRSQRNTVCACEATTDPTLSQALHLINGDTVERKMAEGRLVDSLLEAGKTPPEVIEQMYVRSLSRKPTPEELPKLLALVPSEGDVKPALYDMYWAVLNSREFLFNH